MNIELKNNIVALTNQALELIKQEDFDGLEKVLSRRQSIIEMLWRTTSEKGINDVRDFLANLIEQDKSSLAKLISLKQQLDIQERNREKSQKKITQYLAINKYR